MTMLEALFGSTNFIPHGHCYLWSPSLVFLEVGSNLLIGLSYLVIGGVTAHLMHRLREFPFRFVYLAIASLFLTCGITHFFDVLVIWEPYYWADASFRVMTALASVATAALLPPLVPKAVNIFRGARSAAKKGIRLETAVDDLENMYRKTKELEEKKTDFFAKVSHELRTPLTLVLGETRRLLESDLDDTQRESVESILENSRLLLNQVEDLLDIASHDAGELKLEFERFELGELIGRMSGAFQGLADEYDIDFRRDYPDELFVRADERKFESLLSNLLSNAFKFTPDGGTVVCRVAVEGDGADQEGEWVVLEVRDSGPGVPEEYREEIFGRFEQVDDEAAVRFGGTGLGLVVVRNYVELHGGEVDIEDAPEGGASFVVRLPVVASGDENEHPENDSPGAEESNLQSSVSDGESAEAGRSESEDLAARVEKSRRSPTPETLPSLELDDPDRDVVVPPSAQGRDDEEPERSQAGQRAESEGGPENSASVDSTAAGEPRVLVVEDNPEMNDYICRLLDDVTTLSVYDGEEALEKVRDHRIDVVLTDLVMPNTSGIELVDELSEIGDIPILVVTAKADDRHRMDVLKRGANDFLAKPFSPEELRTRASNLVSIQRTRRVLQRQLETRRKSVEELARKVSAKQSKLEQALETAELARRHAERASAMKTEFLGMVSHELRTPLTALQMQLELMREQLDAPVEERRELVDRSTRVLERLLKLIENLLDQAALESGQLQVSPNSFELEELLRELVAEHRPHAGSKDLELELDIRGDLQTVETDERMVQLIVSNLVRNAVDYTNSGGIYITARQSDGDSTVRVRDTGPGIDMNEQSELFRAFERGEQGASMEVSGLGVGLSIVRDMTRALGGSVQIEAEVGEGSTFIVSFPSSYRTVSDDED